MTSHHTCVKRVQRCVGEVAQSNDETISLRDGAEPLYILCYHGNKYCSDRKGEILLYCFDEMWLWQQWQLHHGDRPL